MGQSYLQQANYDAAKEVFRQWALDDPQNWKPSCSLSLAYSYQNKGQEASSLADWANNIAGNEKNSGCQKRREARGLGEEVASNLSQITKAVLKTKGASDPDTFRTLQTHFGEVCSAGINRA